MKKLQRKEPAVKALSRVDKNFIMRQIVMNYAFRVTRLIIIVFSISYFLSIFWYIFVWLLYEHNYHLKITFFEYYSFDEYREQDDDFSA